MKTEITGNEPLHTPGPWKQDEKFGQIQSSKGSTIVMSFGRSAKPEDKALIAAAPQLLEALIEVRDRLSLYATDSGDRDAMKVADAAINTALNK